MSSPFRSATDRECADPGPIRLTQSAVAGADSTAAMMQGGNVDAPNVEPAVTDDQMRVKAALLLHEHLGLDRPFTDTTTLDELRADSLDRIEVGMALEAEFGVEIPDTVIGEWRTVGDLLDWLVARKTQRRR